ncbi:MAG: hypothetical protein QG673_498 [Pseudomonadota bacterium]|nr:hypothetical protein [Pseudomonadota bacterium]
MIQYLIEHLARPNPFIVLGVLYGVVAAFYLQDFIRSGYWSGMLGSMRLIWLHYLNSSRWYALLLALVILLVLFIFVDLPMAQLCKHYYSYNIYKIFDFINVMGEGWFIGGVIFTCFMIFQFLEKSQLAIVAKISFMAAIYSCIVSTILKMLFNRERPGIGMDQWNFFHFFTTKHPHDLFYSSNSMPSGHAITIFAAILPVILYNKNIVFKAFMLFLAVVIIIARVYTLNHWLSDVYVSTLLGVLIGWSVFLSNNHRLNDHSLKYKGEC